MKNKDKPAFPGRRRYGYIIEAQGGYFVLQKKEQEVSTLRLTCHIVNDDFIDKLGDDGKRSIPVNKVFLAAEWLHR